VKQAIRSTVGLVLYNKNPKAILIVFLKF